MNIEVELPREEMENFLAEITQNKDWLYLLAPFSIGDFLIAGGLSYAAQVKKNKSATVLIAQDRMKNLGITFENVVGTIYLPIDLINAVGTFITATENYERDNFFYGNYKIGDDRAYDDSINAVDRFKRYVFDLPLSTPLMPPIVEPLTDEKIYNLREKYFLNRERTIILLPYAKTFETLDINFWIRLVKIFADKNYIVYTNVAGDEQPVAGTEPLNVNFAELNFIADKVKCFIGLRSGVFDFLGMTDAKIFCLLKFAMWDWDIKFLYGHDNGRTFYDAVKYKKPLEDYLKAKGLPPKIELSHPHIDSRDIYFSYDDILNAIVNEVEKV